MGELEGISGLEEPILIDTSENNPVYLIYGKNRTCLKVSKYAYQLLQGRKSGLSFEQICETITHPAGRRFSPGELEAIYNGLVEKISRVEQKPKRKLSHFLFRLPFLPSHVVNKIAFFLCAAFYPPVAVFLLACILGSIIYTLGSGMTLDPTLSGFGWGYLLLMFSILMHELGHAAACVYYGVKSNEIGFTLYLIWPAFYCDVSPAWRLKRRERVVVDLGGVFFELITAFMYVLAYTISGFEPFKMALVMITTCVLFSLNPIFKFDGYWVVCDTLGVTNMDEQKWHIIEYIINRIRGRSIKPLPWPPLILGILGVFTILSFSVWGYFLINLFPIIWENIVKYPSILSSFFSDLFSSPKKLDMEKLKALLSSTLVVIITFWLLSRLIKKLVGVIKPSHKLRSFQ